MIHTTAFSTSNVRFFLIFRMSEVPRKRYRRESLEEDKKLSDESGDEELYIPLKERRKLQFSALEQNQGNHHYPIM